MEYLVWTHPRTHPIVQVVMMALVADSELEFLQEDGVIHHVEGSEDVKAVLSVRENSINAVIQQKLQ